MQVLQQKKNKRGDWKAFYWLTRMTHHDEAKHGQCALGIFNQTYQVLKTND